MDLVVRFLHKYQNMEFDGMRFSVLDVLPKLTKEGKKPSKSLPEKVKKLGQPRSLFIGQRNDASLQKSKK